MKTKAKTRVLSLVLALVMLLPLISIPTFAEGKTDGKSSFTQDFENTGFADAIAEDNRTAYSAKLVEASKSSTTHGNVFRMDVTPADREGIYLVKYDKSPASYKFNLTEAQYQDAMEKGVIAGTAYGIGSTTGNITVAAEQKINTGSVYASFETFTQNNVKYAIVTGDAYKAADAQYGLIGGNVSTPVKIEHPALSGDGAYIVIECDLYLSEDFLSEKGIQGRLYHTAKLEFPLLKITRKQGETDATLTTRDGAKVVKSGTKGLSVGVWHTLTMVINRTTGHIEMYADGVYVYTARKETISENNTTPLTFLANSLDFEVARMTTIAKLGGFFEVDNVSIEMVDERKFIRTLRHSICPARGS